MIVHDSWWSNGNARSTIIDYQEPFDQALKKPKTIIHLSVGESVGYLPLLL